jgi:integrase/recombinase XerD
MRTTIVRQNAVDVANRWGSAGFWLRGLAGYMTLTIAVGNGHWNMACTITLDWVCFCILIDRSGAKIVSLGKQAKPLTKGQIDAVVSYLAKTRHPTRNRLIFLLSIRAGLRAREIALLTWSMVTDAEGKIGRAIALQDGASKGRSGRIVPLHTKLRTSLIGWHKLQQPASDSRIIRTERSKQTSLRSS